MYERPADARDLTPEELEEYDADALARYRKMIGADLPPKERARRSREAAARVDALRQNFDHRMGFDLSDEDRAAMIRERHAR